MSAEPLGHVLSLSESFLTNAPLAFQFCTRNRQMFPEEYILHTVCSPRNSVVSSLCFKLNPTHRTFSLSPLSPASLVSLLQRDYLWKAMLQLPIAAHAHAFRRTCGSWGPLKSFQIWLGVTFTSAPVFGLPNFWLGLRPVFGSGL